jgi:hypothetical protein
MTDETIQKLLTLFDHDVPNEGPTLVEARVVAPAGSDPRGVAIELSAARDGEKKRVTIRGDHDGIRALGETLVSAVDDLEISDIDTETEAPEQSPPEDQ